MAQILIEVLNKTKLRIDTRVELNPKNQKILREWSLSVENILFTLIVFH